MDQRIDHEEPARPDGVQEDPPSTGGIAVPAPTEPVFSSPPIEPEVELEDDQEDPDFRLPAHEEARILAHDHSPDTPLWRQMRDRKIAYYTSLGHSALWIGKKLGVTHMAVCSRLKKPSVARQVVHFQRIIIEKTRAELFKGFAKALQVQRDNLEIDPPEDPKQSAIYFRKKRHELAAAQHLSDQAMKFIQSDHALQKLEERLFGPKTSSGPAVALQINNNTDLPSQRALAYADIVKQFPEEQQRIVAEKLKLVMPEEKKPDAPRA